MGSDVSNDHICVDNDLGDDPPKCVDDRRSSIMNEPRVMIDVSSACLCWVYAQLGRYIPYP